ESGFADAAVSIRQSGAEITFAREYALYRGLDLGRLAFQKIALRACGQRAFDVTGLVVAGEDQAARPWMMFAQRGDQFDASHHRQRHVDHRHVRLHRLEFAQRGLRTLGGAANREPRHLVAPPAQQIAHARMILDDIDAVAHRNPWYWGNATAGRGG